MYYQKGKWHEWEVLIQLCTYWLLFLLYLNSPKTILGMFLWEIIFVFVLGGITYGYHKKLKDFSKNQERILTILVYMVIPILAMIKFR
ncbi:MAG: hypothetical protein Q4Q07_00220 [Tissierellia bacterium]|nr:hypothetical protein [Tissierellia bacterium]